MASWLSAGLAWANSAPLPVSFDGSAQALPQAEIRVAIATELGRETLAESGEGGEDERERVVVAVDELGQLWVRYWGPRGLVDRHLVLPAHPEQVPLVVSLSVGNLVRQEAFELLRDLERRRSAQAEVKSAPRAKAPERAVSPSPPVQPRRAEPRPSQATAKNAWGAYLARDFVYFPGVDRVCAPTSDIHCYDSAGNPVEWDVDGSGVVSGIVGAHTRLAVSYSRALTPELWASVRAGLALSGGKTKNKAAANGGIEPSFMPFSLELSVRGYPIGGPESGVVRPYLHCAAGISEESGEVSVQEPQTPSGPIQTTPRSAKALRGLGLLFAGAGFGASLKLFDPVRLEAELSGFLAFPSSGWFVRPGIGATYDF
ncbi:MAG TPA: DUF3736 domain-containing protein [Polyangiaceae bacterium]|nr:DUF3736 domain-containing protein [Polyangiaceae bacterium]